MQGIDSVWNAKAGGDSTGMDCSAPEAIGSAGMLRIDMSRNEVNGIAWKASHGSR